ncbi:hypothetical protein HA45_19435 [Pantoea rodasii]|nr:hypothetical protein HA45_19435 [Pantoea rodasii]
MMAVLWVAWVLRKYIRRHRLRLMDEQSALLEAAVEREGAGLMLSLMIKDMLIILAFVVFTLSIGWYICRWIYPDL